MNQELVSVVIPVYNEEDCIVATIEQVETALRASGRSFEIIVVDDGSTDKSAVLASSKNVRVVRHRRNYGVGAARKTGISQAKGSVIVTTDADGTYPNDQIPHLIERYYATDADMVVGARIGKNVVYEWPHRAIPKFLIRKLASYLTQTKIPDLNSGLRVIKKEAALEYFFLLPDSHSWESTITIAFLSNKKIVEFEPIDYFKRKGGRSTFAPIKDTYNYLSLVVRTVMYFNPLRIFIPLSLGVMLAGGIKMIYDWIVYHRIGGLDVIIFVSGVMVVLLGLLADLIVTIGRRSARLV